MPADSLPSPKPGAIPSKPYERRQSKTLTDTDGYKKLMHDARSAENRVRSSYEVPILPSRPVSSLSAAKTPPLDALPIALERGDNMHIDHFGIVRKRPPRHRSLSSGSVADSLECPELRLPRKGKGRATSRDLSAIPEDPSAKIDPNQPESDSDSHRSITPTSPAFPLRDATFTPFDDRLQSPPALLRLRHQSIGPTLPAPTPLPHPAVLSARGSAEPAPATPPSPSTPFVFPRAFSPTAVPIFKVRDLHESDDRPYQDSDKLLYGSTRTDVDLHHNSMAMGVNSLLSSQDAIWNALQVNLDMSRHVLGSVAAHSDVLTPQGNLIKGLVQIQENLVTYVGQSHDSLASYLSAAHAHLADSIREVMDDMNVDPPPPPPDHSDAIATLTQCLLELERVITKKLDRLADTSLSAPRSESHSSSSPRDMDRITQMILDLSRNLNMKIDQRFDALEHRFLAKQATPQGLSNVPQVHVSPAVPSRPSTPGPAPVRPTTPSAAPTVAIKTPKPPCEALSQVQIRTELEKGKPSTTRKKHLKARLTLIESASTTEQFALVAPKPWTSAFHSDASEWFSEQDWAGTDRICLGTEEERHFATLGQAARANAKVTLGAGGVLPSRYIVITL